MSLAKHTAAVQSIFCTLVAASLVVVFATESRGDSVPGLSSVQQTARDEFLEDVKDYLDDVNAACGTTVSLSTDFQNYVPSDDAEAKKNPHSARLKRSVQCRGLLDALASDCRKTKSSVKTIACVFAGHTPYAGNREDYAHRNMEFNASTGLLTLHQGIGAEVTVDDLPPMVAMTLRPGTAQGPSSNGLKCTTDEQCESHLCSGGKCANCYKGPKCHGGNICWGGTHGVCNPPPPESSSEESTPSSPSSASRGGAESKKPKLGSGAKCRFSSECASGRCKAIGGGKAACT